MEKILLYSTKKEIYELIRNIFGKRVQVSHIQNDEIPISAGNFQFILTDCDYQCRLDRCLKKFAFLYQNRTIPSAMIRPILLKDNPKQFPGFYLMVFNDYNPYFFQKRIFTTIKSSRYYAGSSSFPIPPSNPLYKIIQVQKKIAESPEKSLSLSSLAHSSDCSPSWLSSNFKRLSGISLQSYLRKMKCCYALWQLAFTDRPIKTIALEAGYEPLYFSQLFHQTFGTPPSSLRKLSW
ncbi:MAG: helix-turn-helix transcriptional regulator [Candidatus Aminicenantes bacterium]|nr:helix-turn-helix transcriptional regulator [Candidatus Aminicenantes bacterium]